MSGIRGRSGRKPLAADIHQQRATPARGHQRDDQPASNHDATLSPLVTAGLGPRGLAFLTAVFAEYEPTESDALILRLAALAVDDAEAARLAGDQKAERSATRQVLAVLQRLGWPRE